MYFHAWAACCALFSSLLVSQHAESSHATKDLSVLRSRAAVDAAFGLLRTCPMLSEGDGRADNSVIQVKTFHMKVLSSFPDEVLQKAVHRYCSDQRFLALSDTFYCRIFMLNRYLYNLPPDLLQLTAISGQVCLERPVQVGNNGELILFADFQPYFASGPGRDFESEFEEAMTRYGRRPSPGIVGETAERSLLPIVAPKP
jgi:hypothetical protein